MLWLSSKSDFRVTQRKNEVSEKYSCNGIYKATKKTADEANHYVSLLWLVEFPENSALSQITLLLGQVRPPNARFNVSVCGWLRMSTGISRISDKHVDITKIKCPVYIHSAKVSRLHTIGSVQRELKIPHNNK